PSGARLSTVPIPTRRSSDLLPMARSYVARELVKLGGQPVLRDFVTDNGNVILDVHGLNITNPVEMEARINQIVGDEITQYRLTADRKSTRLNSSHVKNSYAV